MFTKRYSAGVLEFATALGLRDLFGRAEKGHILVLGRESLPSLTFSRFYDFLREICSAVRSSATNGGVSFTAERAKNAAGMEGSMVVSRSPPPLEWFCARATPTLMPPLP